MDTATHLVMGVTLGGIATTIDPVLASSDLPMHGIMLATIISSQIPDIDTVLKLKNNAKYIKNHRGITHSIPAIFFWTLAVGGFTSIFFPYLPLLHLILWSFVGVTIHVAVDIFNAYGTQALRPFSAKWIALGVINTFDPVIFGLHAVAAIFILMNFWGGFAAICAYILMIAYYVLRFYYRQRILKEVYLMIRHVDSILVSPTIHLHKYHLAVVTDSTYYVGKVYKKQITILDTFKRIPVPDTKVMRAAKQDPNISSFLSFSPVYRWDVFEYEQYTEVRFIDLRYRTKGDHYPFVAIIKLDKSLQTISSYTGWIFSEEKLQKKIQIRPS